MALTARQLRLIEEYQVDFNASQAALRAGYGPKWAKSQGSRLLGHPEVAAAIAEARERRSGAVALKREEVEAELRRIALDRTQKTGDRLRALELAGKALGLFLDKSELTVSSFEEVVMRAEKKFREASPLKDAAVADPSARPAADA
jgi:hypothetical protein